MKSILFVSCLLLLLVSQLVQANMVDDLIDQMASQIPNGRFTKEQRYPPGHVFQRKYDPERLQEWAQFLHEFQAERVPGEKFRICGSYLLQHIRKTCKNQEIQAPTYMVDVQCCFNDCTDELVIGHHCRDRLHENRSLNDF